IVVIVVVIRGSVRRGLCEDAFELVIAHQGSDEHRFELARQLARQLGQRRRAFVVTQLAQLVECGNMRRLRALDALEQRTMRDAVAEPTPRELCYVRLRGLEL